MQQGAGLVSGACVSWSVEIKQEILKKKWKKEKKIKGKTSPKEYRIEANIMS